MKDGKLPKAGRALLSDSFSATIGSMFGTTPSTAYIESSAGVAAGGRTGLTTVTVAVLFALAAFFTISKCRFWCISYYCTIINYRW